MHEPYLICSWIYICICIQFNILYLNKASDTYIFSLGRKYTSYLIYCEIRIFFIMRYKIYIYKVRWLCVSHRSGISVVALKSKYNKFTSCIFSSQPLEEDHGLWYMCLIQHKNFQLVRIKFLCNKYLTIFFCLCRLGVPVLY